MVPRRVLVVDDEASILHSTAALLRDLGYEVATCSEASGILPAIERAAPDLLLQDVRMPGLDLERVVFDIRTRWPAMPIVLFTAGMDADEVADRVRANAVIEKPFRLDDLLATLRGAIRMDA